MKSWLMTKIVVVLSRCQEGTAQKDVIIVFHGQSAIGTWTFGAEAESASDRSLSLSFAREEPVWGCTASI